MPSRINSLAAYGKVANAESDPIQQIVMLYDGAIKFLRLAAADIEIGNLTAKAEHSNRALDIISYLKSILNFENGGDVAPILDGFYSTLIVQVLGASAALDGKKMKGAADSLMPVRDAWAASAAMINTALPVTTPAAIGTYQNVA